MNCYCVDCQAERDNEREALDKFDEAEAIRKMAAVYHIVLQKKILTVLKNRERITPA